LRAKLASLSIIKEKAVVAPKSKPVHGTDPGLNTCIDHIELLHHCCTVTSKTISPQRDHQDTWQVCSCIIVLNPNHSRGFSSPVLDVASYTLVLSILRNLCERTLVSCEFVFIPILCKAGRSNTIRAASEMEGCFQDRLYRR
jgi:hypothetical protein